MEKVKLKKGKIAIWMIIVIAVLLVIGFVVSGILYFNVMNKHINTYQNSRGIPVFANYEDSGMIREESNFLSNHQEQLNGYFYRRSSQQNFKGVIIVNNGFGSGHEAMLGEIEALIDCGYLVYGFDKTGFDQSEGKGIRSISQGVDDLLLAIEHVKTDPKSKNLDIILYGKSYGAYCCLAVLDKTEDVSKVIAMSAFNRSSDMLESEVTRRIGKFGVLLVPSLKLFDLINEKGYTACKGIEHTNAKVLIMHSTDDPVVSYEDSFLTFHEKAKGKENIHFLSWDNKGHTIIKSEESVQYNKQMDEDLQVFAKNHNDEMTDELWDEFLSRYDLKKCTKPDSYMIELIDEFLMSCDDK